MELPSGLKRLATAAEREAALDAIGDWLVEQLSAATASEEHARSAIAAAIAAFYDVRQSAGQPRGEYAGHFFYVDAVGLGSTGRPVPWTALREKVGAARAEALARLFDAVEPGVD